VAFLRLAHEKATGKLAYVIYEEELERQSLAKLLTKK
jgi:hypothetical protein